MKTVPVRNIVFTALFAALFVVMSSFTFKIPVSPLPLTLQTLAVMLAGAFLGPTLGFLSIFVVVALTALGLPLLHGEGGIAVIKGYSGGFILMFPVCALAVGLAVKAVLRTGLLARHKAAGFAVLFVLFEILVTFLVYVGGIPWLAGAIDKPIASTLSAYCYPYLFTDTLKAAIAAFAMTALYDFSPAFRQTRRTDFHFTGKAAS